MKRGLTLLVIGLALARTPAAAQLPDQSFEVVPEVVRVTLGDTVPLRFRVRLDERDLLYDTVPKATDVPQGVQVLSVEKLRRGPDRIFTGRARVAFYRTGRQAVPVFSLDFMRGVKGVTRGTLWSDSAYVEIEPVAGAGNPSLKDIKEIARRRRPDPLLVAAALSAAAGGVAVGLARRRRKPQRPRPPPAPSAPARVPRLPYAVALARLAELEQEGPRSDHGAYYETVANVLRDYLAAATAVPARQRTTAELIDALPPRLAADGLRERCQGAFADADLVKFARAGRDPGSAQQFARDARCLLEAWDAALSQER